MRARRCASCRRSRRASPARAWLVLCGLVVGLGGAAPAQEASGPVTDPELRQQGLALERVAVLPFRVHSARPLEPVGEALADQLRANLQASGEVAVLDAAASRGVRADVTTRDEALRAIAREVLADYVVTGSLTELAGRFSLDIRITPEAAGSPSTTRVFTAADRDALFARMGQVTNTVLESVVGASPAMVTSVEMTGAAGFEPELLARLETREGLPYDPESVRSDLASLRSSPAVVSVDAETERTDEGVAVRFDIVLADPSLAEPDLAGGEVISEIRVRGNRRIEEGAIRARIGSKEGERYDPAQIARDIAEVHALGFFRNVRVYADTTPDGGRVLVFEVEENPVVRQIAITGNENVEGDEIRDILTLTTGSTLDYPLLYENRLRIESLYRGKGYYLAEVTFEITPLGEASVGIDFAVIENEKLKLREISFTGNEHFDDDELTEGFETRRWRFWSYLTSYFDKSGTYSEPLFLQDLRRLERRYSDDGFLQVRIGEPEVIPEEDGLRVVVDIEEGRRFKVGELKLTGDSTVDLEALEDDLRLSEGEYFNRSHLTRDISMLTEFYQDRGFYFAQVNPLSNLSPDSEVVDVSFEVRKGPLYFIRRINVSGNTTTVDPIVRREIPIVEGQLYSQRAVMLARARIEGLGFFEEVDFQVQPTEEPDQLDLDVTVVERPTGSFSFGAGFSSRDGLVLQGSLAQSNLFGRGYKANVNVELGGEVQRYFVNLSDPYFMGTDFSLGATVSRQTFDINDFEQEQTGAGLVLGRSLTEDNRTRGSVRYAFNQRSLLDDSNVSAAAPILREILQDELVSSLVGISLVRDTRDDRFAPTSGHNLVLSLEGAGLGGFSRFFRVEGRAAFFLGAPSWLLDRSSFVWSTRLGWTVPFNSISDYDGRPLNPGELGTVVGFGDNLRPLDQIDRDLKLPLTERYLLGGLGTFGLRGFERQTVGPRRSILQEVPSQETGPQTGIYAPLGYVVDQNNELVCPEGVVCNDLDDEDIDDFENLDATDVVGGNKFVVSSFEYRFPISQAVGLQGVFFIDMGNSFAEGDYNLLDVTEWRYGTGGGIQWFSPFGPLAVILGFPLDRLSVEDASVFEFSVGGVGF